MVLESTMGGVEPETLNPEPKTPRWGGGGGDFPSFLVISSLELSDTHVYEPQIQALLGIASFWRGVYPVERMVLEKALSGSGNVPNLHPRETTSRQRVHY